MTTQISFTRFEKEILPKFRKNMNVAESTEDVKKFFSYSMQEFLAKIFSENFTPSYEDIQLQADQDPPYLLSEAVRQLENYPATWEQSDFAEILLRFSNMAKKRHDNLAKKTEKAETKIRI